MERAIKLRLNTSRFISLMSKTRRGYDDEDEDEYKSIKTKNLQEGNHTEVIQEDTEKVQTTRKESSAHHYCTRMTSKLSPRTSSKRLEVGR